MRSRRSVLYNTEAKEKRLEFPDVVGLKEFHESLPNYGVTPLRPLPEVARELGIRGVYVKDESSRFGLPAFKVLGASWGCYRAVTKELGLSPEVGLEETIKAVSQSQLTMKLIAATEGNHGRAVAFIGKLLGIETEIFVPGKMDEATREFIRSEGAIVTVIEGNYDETVNAASIASNKRKGAILVQDTAFDGYEEIPSWIVEGYTTMMREIEEQLNDKCTMMITPVGVGSLAHAVARYCKSRDISVVSVEPDTAPCLYSSLSSQKLETVSTSATIMDGMNCGTVSSTAWPDLKKCVDGCVTVSDYEVHYGVEYLSSQSIRAGPCGAAPLAALKTLVGFGDSPLLDENSVVVLLSTEGPREYRVPLDVSIEDVAELTQTLTKIDSSNSSLSRTDGAGETEIVDYISAWFAHRDIEHHRIENVAGRPSVVGVLRGLSGGKGPNLMFNGHVDTVTLSSYAADPLSGEIGQKNGEQVVFGRGSLDMKGGLAASLAALSYAKGLGHPFEGDVVVAAVSDEEDASQGTRDIIEAGWKADFAVIPEPTNGKLVTAHKGFIWIEVDILGKAAHGSDPSAGQDAILHAGWFLQAFEEYQKTLPVDEILGSATAHCGLIRGGEEPSSYPAKCTITLEFRTVPEQTEKSLLNDMSSLLQQVGNKKPTFQYSEPRATIVRPPQKLPRDHPLVQKAAESASFIQGHPVEMGTVPFWCDAAFLTQSGTPSIVLGPNGEGLHAEQEWVSTKSLIQTMQTFCLFMDTFCKKVSK
jgi:diaminopropionate ammonia-lyase family